MLQDPRPARYQLVNPADGSLAGEAPDLGPEEVDGRVNAAHRALNGPWANLAPLERAELLSALAQAVRAEVEPLARAETATNGKPITQTRGEIRKAADILSYAATLTSHLSGRTIPIGGSRYAFTFEQPIGVVAALVPWNSPLIIAAMMAGPALAAGCPVIVKPAPSTPLEALRLAELASEVGFPDDVLQTVTGRDDRVGRLLVEHPLTAKVAFTGSTRVGRDIAVTAANRFASVLLELGGKSPVGVFEDADLRRAAAGVGDGIVLSAGQSCVTPSRLLVHEKVADKFIAALRAHLAKTIIGPPLDPATQMGPLSSMEHAQRVRGFVERALAAGCEMTISHPDRSGLPAGPCYEPLQVLRVPDTSVELWREEVFGPVLAWTTFADEREFVELANDSTYGLGAVVWTTSYPRIMRLTSALEAGMIWINSQRKTEISAPFGGLKYSGVGRENGVESLREFLVTKTLYLGMEGDSVVS